jgi:putative oxidoreductase
MGLILLVSGYRKFATGLGAVAAGFAKIPIPLPSVAAPFIATLELVGGLLLLVGLGTRWLGLLFVCEHLVTTFWVKFRLQGWNDGRLELLLLAGAIMLFLAGSGSPAIDAAREGTGSRWRPWV